MSFEMRAAGEDANGERAGPPSLSPPLGSPPLFSCPFFFFFETCTLMFRVSAQRATDSRVRIRVAVPASACVAGQLEKTQSSHGSSASRWFGVSSTWDDEGGDKHCHVSFEIPAQSLMTWTIVEFPNILSFWNFRGCAAPDRYVRQLRVWEAWWCCLQVVFLPRVRQRRALHFSFFFFPAPLHVVIRSACAVCVCVRGAMTAFVVKETLRKCPSDPARLSTTAPSTTSPKSPLSPLAKSVASTSKSSSSTSALHLAPFSKCVLTLDGYNYVISKSAERDNWNSSTATAGGHLMKTHPFSGWQPAAGVGHDIMGPCSWLVSYRSRFIIQIYSLPFFLFFYKKKKMFLPRYFWMLPLHDPLNSFVFV